MKYILLIATLFLGVSFGYSQTKATSFPRGRTESYERELTSAQYDKLLAKMKLQPIDASNQRALSMTDTTGACYGSSCTVMYNSAEEESITMAIGIPMPDNKISRMHFDIYKDKDAHIELIDPVNIPPDIVKRLSSTWLTIITQ